jgi:hypothetical protein
VSRTRPQPETRAQSNLLNVAAVIWSERPSEKDAAYMARQLVQATLPHKNPGQVPLWKRTNGNLTLAIQPGIDVQSGQSYGYPYGTVPRLLLFLMTTETVKTKSRRLELGHTLSEFMTELWHLLAGESEFLPVDNDPQGSLTILFEHDHNKLDEEEKTLHFSLVGERPLSELAIGENPKLIPASETLASAESEFATNMLLNGVNAMKERVQEVRDQYDFILIDCLPSLGVLCLGALVASDYVLIPVETNTGIAHTSTSRDPPSQRLFTKGNSDEIALIENIQREDLSPMDLAEGL